MKSNPKFKIYLLKAGGNYAFGVAIVAAESSFLAAKLLEGKDPRVHFSGRGCEIIILKDLEYLGDKEAILSLTIKGE